MSAQLDNQPEATADGRDPVAWAFPVVWTVFRLVTWALVLVVLSPEVLRYVGWNEAARWILAHGWVRWVAAPLLAPFAVLSAFHPIASRKAGSTAVDPILGLRQGEPVRWEAGARVVEAGTWMARRERRVVAQTTIRGMSTFGFQARAARLEPPWMRGMAQDAVRAGLRGNQRAETDAAAAAREAMAFLGHAPLDLAGTPLRGTIVLRSSDPGRARGIFSSADVVRAIEALERGQTRWDLSLLPTGKPEESLLRFECRGSLDRADRAAQVKALMVAVLARLDA